ncbi:nucleoside diphosphate kinase 7 [Plasmopara halstedii]|uniref:Nucleoside diphosphate kinase 7 n=1 Tax=Plasmopara halstedii TaxID=4781 RepID=A0A0P1B7A0_PLAHL|nr:nucleoside diphosphate kinase 7 [Plasmopara halstedii]CEG49725.1 nucleoside diphosphate kinase 7 [Plasmopara halstedii]|eukprot:XP_024586094.1 nucleoside diphosphate kinase 7 [Plasmopara halstedii]
MQAIRETIYSFKARWFDTHAQLNRHYNVRYFVDTHNVEIFDTKTSRLFLKKSECPPTLSAKDFFLGAKVLIYGRHFELQDYLDPFTAEKLGRQQQKSVLVIKKRMVDHIGAILQFLSHQKFAFSAIKMMRVDRSQAEKLFELHRGTDDFENRVDQLTSAPVVAMEIVQENCLEVLKQVVTNLSSRFDAQPGELQCAASVLEANQLRTFYFETLHASTATFENCTCCVVLPHVIKEGLVGDVVSAIQRDSGVRITAMELFRLDRINAAEFLEVYEGVVPHFNESVDHYTTGPCLAMELVGQHTSDVVAQFRVSAGPWDVEMAKELKPQTIRAKFGIDRVRNAIHCTDLPEDGILECQYFFDILSRRQVRSNN